MVYDSGMSSRGHVQTSFSPLSLPNIKAVVLYYKIKRTTTNQESFEYILSSSACCHSPLICFSFHLFQPFVGELRKFTPKYF
ncbi:hypothetical protein ES332_A11G217000v1 [Gossypium tomentosum]|uniref:Uncharacterized protein n=1 Tax=Gossypium tomentosum TaxID=34277 RepID=A0A5D2NHD5_GOSTO|nr:hypothetical protein ES332_A11G217000v1 [Gossypium tomentosum]